MEEGGSFTMFTPTDEAFAKLPPGTLDRIIGRQFHCQKFGFLPHYPRPVHGCRFSRFQRMYHYVSHRSGPNAEINQGA